MTTEDLDAPATEQRNPRTADLDAMSTDALLSAMNDEDRTVADAVRAQLPRIAAVVDATAARLRAGGRLVYCGAGTSGRLGVLDAAECGPTFAAAPGQVTAVIAGGAPALQRAVEGAEDDAAQGAADLQQLGLCSRDAVVGLTASGRTPYVLGALRHARAAGAFTAAVACSPGGPVAAAADVAIEIATGPEVLTGSTRLKAGTAQKLVLNMLSTAVFVRLHKVHGNLMVDLQASNDKLRARSRRIVAQATGSAPAAATAALERCGGEVKTAIVVLAAGVSVATARRLLQELDGSVRAALAQSR
jgi:N-acetylmuramic acid 6-phosphate etherase